MTYKELSAYKDEIMGDILFQLQKNGGSMMESRMDDLLYTFFNNKLNGALATCEATFMKLLTDIYQEMERRGWIIKKGNTFSLTDRGSKVESIGVKLSKDKRLKAKCKSSINYIKWIKIIGFAVAVVMSILAAIGYISEDNLISAILRKLFL